MVGIGVTEEVSAGGSRVGSRVGANTAEGNNREGEAWWGKAGGQLK